MADKNDNLRPNPATQFSSTNQPSGKAKSEGKKKAKLLKEIAAMPVTDTLYSKIKKVADMMGLTQEDVNIELAMHLKQMQNAIDEGDVRSYTALFDRLKGKPKQDISVDGSVTGSFPFDQWNK
jgi:cytolysin (calcineurin-like family phosphatase)